MNKNTVILNGTEYDAHTGLAIRKISTPSPAPTAPSTHAGSLHAHTQRSKTLNRQIVKRSTPTSHPTHHIKVHSTSQRSPHISKFAPHPVVDAKPVVKSMDIGPISHPLVAKAHATHKPAAAPVAIKPSHILKQEAISQALAATPSRKSTEKAHHKTERTKRRSGVRKLSIASACLALMLLAGYFTYLNMPSLSVRVAAAQAGINASYPAYHPDGYSVKGPVAYENGKVAMTFAYRAGPQTYTLSQVKSSWDSTAVLDNYVKEKVGDNYATYSDSGLTIYTYGSSAAWVNGGILYTIDGNAILTSDQIRHIAASM